MYSKKSTFLVTVMVLLLSLLGVAKSQSITKPIDAALLIDYAAVNESGIKLRKGGVIVAEGDSLTYGADFSRHSSINSNFRTDTPYPEMLQKRLLNLVSVENRGYNGDRTVDGLLRWQRSSSGDLALIMYGTNDCENYGHHREGGLTVSTYKAVLRALIDRRLSGGAKVILLLPPPLANISAESRLNAYRFAAIEVAMESKISVFDTTLVLKKYTNPWTDGVHLKSVVYAEIANKLAQYIKIEQ